MAQEDFKPVRKRVRIHPSDSGSFEGTVIYEAEHYYVVEPDDSDLHTENWNKKKCEILN